MHRLLRLGLALVLVPAVVALAPTLLVPSQPAAAAPAVSGDVLVVVGDLVPDPDLNAGTVDHIRTADLTRSIDPHAVIVAGDIQYEAGQLDDYRSTPGYAGSWGRPDLFGRTYPVPGNHEYGNGSNDGWAATGGGYFDYWGAKARPAAASYYSFDVNLPAGGRWHVVVLNSFCVYPPAPLCTSTSAQANWLRSDLAAHPTLCTLAVFHEPLFATRAPHAGKAAMRTLWDVMDDRGVDLVVSGHNHAYERFKPMRADGSLNYSTGIRSTIVGTGGRSLIAFTGAVAPNSAYRDDDHFGVLKLRLTASGWIQAFKTTNGLSLDAVSAGCH
jgi:acid phosphatase type 7